MKKITTSHFKNLVLFIITTLLWCQSPAFAQVQNEEGRDRAPWSQKFDARSLSMGSATLADAHKRVSIGINPALSGLNGPITRYQSNSYHDWNNNLMQHHVTIPTVFIGSHNITSRVGFVHTGFDGINFTKTTPSPAPDVSVYQLDVAYAYTFSEYFSMGVLQNISRAKNDENQFWTYFADLGLAYAPEGYISYGLVYRGLGKETSYEITESGETILSRKFLRQSLELGATLNFPMEERTYLSISFANEKRFGEAGIWYKGGLELLPTSFISVRTGFQFHLNQSVFIPRFGLGLNTDLAIIDYMVSPGFFSGYYFHQIGLTFQF